MTTVSDAREALEFQDHFNRGEICLHPAGRLWGLTCDPRNERSFNRLYDIKKRPRHKKVLFLCQSASLAFKYWPNLGTNWQTLIYRLWPCPISFVAQCAKPYYDPKLTVIAGWRDLGIRMQDSREHPWFAQFWRDHSVHLIPTTSINHSGESPITRCQEIIDFAEAHQVFIPASFRRLSEFTDPVDGLAQPSAIVRIRGEDSYQIIRLGPYQRSAIIAMLDPLRIILTPMQEGRHDE
ncbi:MAG: Sua5/YciO/YrdC/YwlC family protein [Proteobacteria bacterium]|nr:Sua5/YciO/YrdC/YwlC family protein [Pseudomonadota bacterium]